MWDEPDYFVDFGFSARRRADARGKKKKKKFSVTTDGPANGECFAWIWLVILVSALSADCAHCSPWNSAASMAIGPLRRSVGTILQETTLRLGSFYEFERCSLVLWLRRSLR